MWKKILISSIFVLILSTPQQSKAQEAWSCGPLTPPAALSSVNTACGTYTEVFQTGGAYYDYHRVIHGKKIWANQTEALAQRDLLIADTSEGTTSTVAHSLDLMYDEFATHGITKILVYAVRVSKKCTASTTPRSQIDHHVLYYKNYDASVDCAADYGNHHLPFGTENFIFRLTSVCKDSVGNITAESYEFRDLDTGEQKFSSYGDLSTCDEIEIYANSPWYTSALFESDPSEPFVTGSPSDILGSITQDYAQDNETLTGGDDDGSDDSGLLQNIATNTKINASNQQIISEQLTAQGNYQIKLGNEQKVLLAAIASATGGTGTRLDITNSLLGQIRDGLGEGGGGGDGASAVEIGEAVGDELIESTEFTGQTGEEWGVIRGQLEAYRTELGIPTEDEYYPEGGINTPEDFTARMEGLFVDTESGSLFQGVKSILSTNRLSASGSCSASVSIWGQSVSLTVCGMSGALEVFGQILVGLSTIAAILIAFRG